MLVHSSQISVHRFFKKLTVNRELTTVNQRGFTLLELLVVIVIISILVTLTAVSYSNAQLRSRDSKRKSDISALRNALELRFNDNGSYPSAITDLSTNYINPRPKDPKDNAEYDYTSSPSTVYQIWACLENTNDAEKDAADGAAGDLCTTTGRVSYTKTNP